MAKIIEFPRSAPETLDAEALLHETAAKLRESLRSIETHGDGEHDSTIKAIGRVSGAIAQICGQLRQIAKGRRRELAAYSLNEIAAYLRELPPARREELLAAAFGGDGTEPIL